MIVDVIAPLTWEYFCNNCGRLFGFSREDDTKKPTKCMECEGSLLIVGRPGELDAVTLKRNWVEKREV